MTSHILFPRARSDLDEIWDYTFEHWGADQANAYVRMLTAHMVEVAIRPERGHPCADIRPGYLRVAAGSHVIFYRLRHDKVEIVRVLHKRMDFVQHL